MPILMEVVIFQLLITVLNESSVRLSQSLVITVSIFGAIALGQATIDAQFVTSATLAVLSASYILQSMVPSMIFISTIILPLKLYFLLLSAILGLYGIFLGTLVLLLHLCSLRSFGVPYLSLLAPLQPHDQKDVILRGPIDEINQEQHQNKVRKEEYMKETTQ
jgi:spore germination protein KA